MDNHLVQLLEELARFGRENDGRETERPKRMLNITPDTGRLLWILLRATRAGRILEVGTSNGYSTLWLADAAEAGDGKVTTLEFNPVKAALARENLSRARLAHRVDIVEGRAEDTLKNLVGPFDFIFLDADRVNYLTYLELVKPKLKTGGILVADNVTSHPDELRDYLAHVKSDPAFFSVTVPVGNGEEISIKIG